MELFESEIGNIGKRKHWKMVLVTFENRIIGNGIIGKWNRKMPLENWIMELNLFEDRMRNIERWS